MTDANKTRDIRTMVKQFRSCDHWGISLARDLTWVIAGVGCIAIALFVICGTWPAVVTIESESMVPNMNVGDLVVMVQKDRFGNLQTWDDGVRSGYKKFGDYGDVIIYRPNGATDMWTSIGLLPFSKAQHPIIHRAMTWIEAGHPVPSYLNIYRGKVSPNGYLPLTVSGETASGFQILSTGARMPAANYTPGTADITMRTPQGNYILTADAIVPNSGYVRNTSTVTAHGGYITKGDNNNFSDQGYLAFHGTGSVEPVKKEWVVGKALFTVPYVGLLPLHIAEVIIAVIVLMMLHELYLRRKENEVPAKSQKMGRKNQR
ncbi:MAG: S26 family signal peptidase [Methanomicrobiales archaeon]